MTGCRRFGVLLLATFLLWACESTPVAAPTPLAGQGWIATWTSPPGPFLPGGQSAYLQAYDNVSIRQLLRVDAGGTDLRVRLTNELGSEALHVGAMSLAPVSAEGALGDAVEDPCEDPRENETRQVTFGGNREVVVPAGASLLSDPVRVTLERFDDIAISTYFPGPTKPTGHRHKVALSPRGDHTNEVTWPEQVVVRGATAISGIEIHGSGRRRVLVAFGDSITEGAGATPGAHLSWPEQLSRRLSGNPSTQDWVVVNAGISGNRLLHDGGSQNALARFGRDVLSIAGVTDIIVLEGINDLGVAYAPDRPRDVVDADDLILAYGQLVERAHTRGLRIFGATILPYAGAIYFSPEGETRREKVNAWIRTSGVFDGVIDLDALMRDPGDPKRLNEDYEIGDRLHPNDTGYSAIADAVAAFIEGLPKSPVVGVK